MRIGLVIYGALDTISGGYLYDRKLVEYLRAQGDSVEIFSLPWRNYFAHLTDNLHFRLPPGLDILIQDELNHASLILANRAPRQYPVISLVHHLNSSEQHPRWQQVFYQFIEAHYLRSVDGFIFNSETTKAVVEKTAGDRVPNVVAHPPTDKFGGGVTSQEIENRAAQPGSLRLLFLGSITPRKGLHTLLESIRMSPNEIQLDVVGSLDSDHRYARKMQHTTVTSGLNSQVTFHGSVNDQKLSALMRSAHVLVVPSLYEGFGIAYLEGMSFGLPAIGTDVGAAGEIIKAETGFLISPGDAVSLAGQIALLAKDRSLLVKMSLNALKRYKQQPPWSDTASTIRKFIQTQVLSFCGQLKA